MLLHGVSEYFFGAIQGTAVFLPISSCTVSVLLRDKELTDEVKCFVVAMVVGVLLSDP